MSDTRIALVSGANRGIGLEIVKQLSRLGIMTALGTRDAAKGEAAADKLRSEGLEVPVVKLDVGDPASCRAAVADVVAMFGRIDVLVNNAGILDGRPGTPEASVETVSPQAVLQSFVTNTIGPLMLTHTALPEMRRGGYGRIVNVSSGLGQLSEMGSGFPAYRLSKAA
ncbi:MAG: SDR family NAD(P)-dependent oxidoreductase, partial [Hyphomicrobiaceae bacterium]